MTEITKPISIQTETRATRRSVMAVLIFMLFWCADPARGIKSLIPGPPS
jgi:hypothetical protein